MTPLRLSWLLIAAAALADTGTRVPMQAIQKHSAEASWAAKKVDATRPIDIAIQKELWSVDLGGCIESTPAVWNGRIFVGTRAGGIYAIG